MSDSIRIRKRTADTAALTGTPAASLRLPNEKSGKRVKIEQSTQTVTSAQAPVTDASHAITAEYQIGAFKPQPQPHTRQNPLGDAQPSVRQRQAPDGFRPPPKLPIDDAQLIEKSVYDSQVPLRTLVVPKVSLAELEGLLSEVPTGPIVRHNTSPARDKIIFDWDDALAPSSHILVAKRRGEAVDDALLPLIDRASALRLRQALERGDTFIVSNGGSRWLNYCLSQMPETAALVRQIKEQPLDKERYASIDGRRATLRDQIEQALSSHEPKAHLISARSWFGPFTESASNKTHVFGALYDACLATEQMPEQFISIGDGFDEQYASMQLEPVRRIEMSQDSSPVSLLRQNLLLGQEIVRVDEEPSNERVQLVDAVATSRHKTQTL